MAPPYIRDEEHGIHCNKSPHRLPPTKPLSCCAWWLFSWEIKLSHSHDRDSARTASVHRQTDLSGLTTILALVDTGPRKV
jgi:hypothetical protein